MSAAYPAAPSLNRLAVSATTHCLTGCAIGEVLGLVLATWWGWDVLPSIALAIVLAFVAAYALTMRQLLGANVPSAGRCASPSPPTRCRSSSWRRSTMR